MKTVEIDLRTYCQLADFSYKSGYVNRLLRNGDLPSFCLGSRKIGTTWLLSVLKSWYETKID